MHWTYIEYLETPSNFIDTIVEMLRAESKANNRKK